MPTVAEQGCWISGENARIAITAPAAGLSAAAHAVRSWVFCRMSCSKDRSSFRLGGGLSKYQKGKLSWPNAEPARAALYLYSMAVKRDAVWGDGQTGARKQGNVRLNADGSRLRGKRATSDQPGKCRGAEGRIDRLRDRHPCNPNLFGAVPAAILPHVQSSSISRRIFDEHIIVTESGDAGIAHALGLASDPAQRNIVNDPQSGGAISLRVDGTPNGKGA